MGYRLTTIYCRQLSTLNIIHIATPHLGEPEHVATEQTVLYNRTIMTRFMEPLAGMLQTRAYRPAYLSYCFRNGQDLHGHGLLLGKPSRSSYVNPHLPMFDWRAHS